MSIPPDVVEVDTRAQRIRGLILDVDGVLTDGRLHYGADGREGKVFHVRDGLGIQLFIAWGGTAALLSGRESDAVVRRGHELGIELLYLGIDDKVSAYESLLERMHLTDQEIAYAGDDLPDIPILKRVGLSFAPADAAPEVRAAAHVVLRSGGGQGAVRELCERILKAKGAWAV